MCWEKNDQIKVFCDKKLKNILNDGVEDSKTTFNLIDESGEVVWIILEDRDFNELVASAFTTVNALSQEINNESVMGLIFPEKGKIKVNVSIFGRPTPVELDYTQVEKVS